MSPVAEHPDTNHVGRGVLLTLGGAVLGAAVGLLTALQSGERTRRRLVRKAQDAREQVADWYGEVTETVEDLRRGVTGKLAVGKRYLDQTRRQLLARAPGRPNPVSRLFDTLQG